MPLSALQPMPSLGGRWGKKREPAPYVLVATAEFYVFIHGLSAGWKEMW